MELTEHELEIERAAVFLDYAGSASCDYAAEPWHGYGFHYDEAPEWLCDELDPERSYVSVLHAGFSAPTVPPGYRVLHQSGLGERECPWCGSGTGNEHTRDECKLCEGNGLLYWGEDWSLVVFETLALDDLDQDERDYALAACWTASDDDGEPLWDMSGEFTWECVDLEFSPETIAHIKADCAIWRDRFPDLKGWGHDLWLTRNGHGTGFWDREASEYPGHTLDSLSEAARGMGENHVCLDENGRICLEG